MKLIYFIVIALMIFQTSMAQYPFRHYTEAIDVRYSDKQPVVNYTLMVDTNNLSILTVELHLRNIPDSFHVAMFVHPEYDDRYYRYIEDLQVITKERTGIIKKKENTLWQVIAKGGEVWIRYRLHLPDQEGQRAAWKPFLSSTGGLIGGPHSYLYVVGATLAPSYVHLKLPKGWEIATGLQATADPNTFFAATVNALVDGPILAGKLKNWSFSIDGVPHRVVYWPSLNAKIFDTTALVTSIQKLVQQAVGLFGRLPYRDYSFLLQDDSYGALEHSTSVTLGMPSAQLVTRMEGYLSEIAHEYIHTWNIIRIRPVEYGDVSNIKPPLSKGLWWSEGLTMFYADLLLRRAGLRVSQPSREDHLKAILDRYFSNPGNHKISAEKVSMASYAAPGFLGDYDASTHLQGELIGTMLDILIRDATYGKKSMDDVMRKMMEHFSGEKGFAGRDVERIISEISGSWVHQFFEDHIRGNKTIDVRKHLQLIGLKADISWIDAVDTSNKPVPDWRLRIYQSPDEQSFLLGINDPQSSWGKAGIHTGDQLLSINRKQIKAGRDFYEIIRNTKVGDHLQFEIQRKESPFKTEVIVSGFKRADIKLEEFPKNEKQRSLLEQWKGGYSGSIVIK